MRLTHLVLTPTHAVFAEGRWYLKPYQRGEEPYFIEHIRHGVELAAADPAALWICSGGQTKEAAGPRSEALGYWTLAEQHAWWGHPEVRARSALEEFALDSFQNLLFGFCRFREYTGEDPERATVAGWRFKAARFEFYRERIGFPEERFRYVEVNDPPDLASAAAEEGRTLEAFRADPCGPDLEEKRRRRNPFRRRHGYRISMERCGWRELNFPD